VTESPLLRFYDFAPLKLLLTRFQAIYFLLLSFQFCYTNQTLHVVRVLLVPESSVAMNMNAIPLSINPKDSNACPVRKTNNVKWRLHELETGITGCSTKHSLELHTKNLGEPAQDAKAQPKEMLSLRWNHQGRQRLSKHTPMTKHHVFWRWPMCSRKKEPQVSSTHTSLNITPPINSLFKKLATV